MNSDSYYIRSEQRLSVTIAALIFGPIFMGGPLVIGIWVGSQVDISFLSITFLASMLVVSGFISYHMLMSYHWVELENDIIRGRRFWTRQLVEHSVSDIAEMLPLHAMANTPETALIDYLFGPNRGFVIRFSAGGSTINLIRADMTNVQELAEAIFEKWQASQSKP